MYGWAPLPRTLAAALRDVAHADRRVRQSALADLERLSDGEGRAQALEALRAALTGDAEPELRAAAALALADARATEALPSLIEAADRDEPRVRQLALVAVGELAPRGAEDALRVVRRALEEAAPALRFQALIAASHVMFPPELEPVLVAAAADGEPRVRYLACRLLEQQLAEASTSASEALVGALQALFADADSEVRLSAAVALAARGVEGARQRLIAALNGGEAFQPEDEQAAIDLCARLGWREAMPGLRRRAWTAWYKGASPFSFQARVALARLGDARARRQIVDELGSWSRPVRTRAAVAAGLARLEEARARLVAMRGNERAADAGSVEEALRALDTA